MQHKKNVINEDAKIIQHLLKDDGVFPNSVLPALVYKNVLGLPAGSHPQIIEHIFLANNWKNSWRNGIYTYHHYHSTTHEVLGVYSGSCHIMLGGDEGIEFIIEKSDALIIPAGVAHKNLSCSADFKCVGAYPNGLDFDINYGKQSERPGTDHNLALVQMPATDAIFGADGPLLHYWVKTIA